MDPRRTRSFPLWFGLLGPPFAWAAHLALGDLIFELGCSPGMRSKKILGISLHWWATAETAVLAAITVAAGLLAYRAWRRLVRMSDGTSLHRAHAMAVAGMASSLLYGLLILFGFVPSFVLHSCGTSLVR